MAFRLLDVLAKTYDTKDYPDDQRLDFDRTMSLIVDMCSDERDRQAVFLFRRRRMFFVSAGLLHRCFFFF